MSVAAVLLAAGASRRMRGADKLMETVGGIPLLADRASMLLNSRVDTVIVVLPPDKPARRNALNALELTVAINPDAAEGMASSIRTGLRTCPQNYEAAMILPADMPDLTSQDINRLLDAHIAAPGRILRATSQSGTPGSPVLFLRSFFDELLELTGDESGRAVLARHPDQIDHVALASDHATLDLDTPEAWDSWRANSDR